VFANGDTSTYLYFSTYTKVKVPLSDSLIINRTQAPYQNRRHSDYDSIAVCSQTAPSDDRAGQQGTLQTKSSEFVRKSVAVQITNFEHHAQLRRRAALPSITVTGSPRDTT